MKKLLTIIIIFISTYCSGQYAVDSLPILIKGVLPDMYTLELNLAKYHYATADRLWLNYDSTKYIFRYLVRETPFYYLPVDTNKIIKTPLISRGSVVIKPTDSVWHIHDTIPIDTLYYSGKSDTIMGSIRAIKTLLLKDTLYYSGKGILSFYEDIDEVFIINNTTATYGQNLGITLHGHRKHELGAILLSYPPVYTCVYCRQSFNIYNEYNGMDDYKDALKKYGVNGADSFYLAMWNRQDTSCISAEIELNKHKTKQVVKPKRKHRDTITIVMLVADTSRTRPMLFIKEPAIIGGVTYSETPLVYWTFGYSVGKMRKWRKRWKHSHFLDIHKKPLSVNIFIWQVKKRKQ